MSVVVALKFINGVILGADRQTTSGHIKCTNNMCKTILTNDRT